MNDNLKNNRKNMIWNMIGAMSFGFTSLIYLVIATRINGVNDAGLFTFAYALACIFFTIGSYSGKTYQITESDSEIKDFDYIYNRIFTVSIMLIISILFSVFMQYHLKKFLLIFILTALRGFDVLSDTFHAIIQRNGYLYKAGISLFIRTLSLIIVFLMINLITNDIIISSISILLVGIFFCCFVDFKITKKYLHYSKFDYDNFIKLLKNGFYMFCFLFLSTYIINVAKYILDIFYNNETQAIYGIIVMPASFMALIAIYITQPFLNSIVSYIKENQSKNLIHLLNKILCFIILIGLFVTLLAYFLGIPFLQLIYNINLNNQKINLIFIIIGSIFYSMVNVFSALLVSLRRTLYQLIILVITGIVSIIMNYYLIKSYSLFGASIGYLIIMFIQLILYVIVSIYFIKKDVKK